MIKKKLTFILFNFLGFISLSQSVLTNNDGIIHLDPNTTLYVEGDVLVENAGVIQNSGTIHVQNDWINNSIFNVFLNSNPGTVSMFGTNQTIRGANPTLFYNLQTLNPFQKNLLVDTWVENNLNITSSEVVLNSKTIHLYNPEPDSLEWTSGFVSGDSIGGYLLRSTNRTADYFYPVGSSRLSNIYRAVSFSPSTSDSSVIGVRLSADDPEFDFTGTSITGSTGPFPFNQKDPKALEINNQFYHHIARFHGNSNGISKMYYFDIDENASEDYNSMVVWNNSIPRWSLSNFKTSSSTILPNIGNPDKVMTSPALNFGNDVYALAIEDQVEVFIPKIFSPNGDGINDVLFAYGNRFESFTFIVYNRWGEKVFESSETSIGWDGKFRGVDAQQGVYVYYVEGKLKEGETISQKGDITLIR